MEKSADVTYDPSVGMGYVALPKHAAHGYTEDAFYDQGFLFDMDVGYNLIGIEIFNAAERMAGTGFIEKARDISGGRTDMDGRPVQVTSHAGNRLRERFVDDVKAGTTELEAGQSVTTDELKELLGLRT